MTSYKRHKQQLKDHMPYLRSVKNIPALFLVTILFVHKVFAQLPYTEAGKYEVRTEKNIAYGTATNYMGYTDTLLLDLYKPVNDYNEDRPVLILIHGGTWIGGCKDEASSGIIPLANEFASRGYMVASINYRLGWHKAAYVATPTAAPWPEFYKSLYAADSSEMLRALYRGMQDTKGAIRFLKARNISDSSCIENFYTAGESAGAFIAIATAFLDRDIEKPYACFAIADAPDPQDNLPNAVADCDYHIYPLSATSLERPDLGSVDGDLNINGYNADVKGVLSFFGGVPVEAFTKNWFDNNTDIPLYAYHQTCDGIVNFSYGQPMEVISYNCNLGYTPWHYNYPHMFGNGAIYDSLSALPYQLLSDFQYCDPFITPLFDCIRYGDNGSYHYTADVPQRAINASEFLSPFIKENEVATACHTLYENIFDPEAVYFRVFPNPFKNDLVIQSDASLTNIIVHMMDVAGNRIPANIDIHQNKITIHSEAPAGLYILQLRTDKEHQNFVVAKF